MPEQAKTPNVAFSRGLRDKTGGEPFDPLNCDNQFSKEMVTVEEKSNDDGEAPPINDEMLAKLDGLSPIDDAVLEVRPKGSTFVSVENYGRSQWTITGLVTAVNAAKEEEHYFLKVAYGEHGRIMLNGEWESSKLIHALVPSFIPEPIGFGRYKVELPEVYFYLQHFVDMNVTAAPDPTAWGERLARMHKASQSPTGEFGFHVTTCDGKMAHIVDWEDEWAPFFRKLFLGPKFELATQQVADKVVPRLLGNLRTSNGEKIKPRLIHGDLHEGNVGINKQTGQVLLFDAGSYYAHHEMELGPWRVAFSPDCAVFRNKRKTYFEKYLQNYPAAEPVDEFEDRNRLYSLKGAINCVAGHPGSALRKLAYNNMCYLCEKYAPIDGIDKYDPTLDS